MKKQLILMVSLCVIAPTGAMELTKKQTLLVKDSAPQRQYADDAIVKVLPLGANEPISLSVGLASLSQTLKDLIESSGIDHPLPLPSVPLAIWNSIHEQLEPAYRILNGDDNSRWLYVILTYNILNLDPVDFVELLNAVNYLDIAFLYDLMIDSYDLQKLSADRFGKLSLDVRRVLIMRLALSKLGPVCAHEIGRERAKCGVYSVGIMQDKLVAVSDDDIFGIWDLSQGNWGKLSSRHTLPGRIVGVVGDKIVSYWNDNSFSIWDLNTEVHIVKCTGHTDIISSVCIAGNKVVSASLDKTIRVWNLATGKEIARYDISKQNVYWECMTGDVRRTVYICCVCVAEDKIIFGFGCTVWVMDLATGRLLGRCDGHTGNINSVCVVGNKIVSGGFDSIIRVWDLATFKQLVQCNGHTGCVEAVCAAEDRIISASRDLTVRVWDVATGKQLAQCNGHVQAVKSVCIRGDQIVSGSNDKSVRMWDISVLNRLRALRTMNSEKALLLWVHLQEMEALTTAHAALDNYVPWLEIADLLERNEAATTQKNEPIS